MGEVGIVKQYESKSDEKNNRTIASVAFAM
jgi:hypothetical protein